MRCALSQFSFAAHHKACKAADAPAGGVFALRDCLKVAGVMPRETPVSRPSKPSRPEHKNDERSVQSVKSVKSILVYFSNFSTANINNYYHHQSNAISRNLSREGKYNRGVFSLTSLITPIGPTPLF